MNLILRNSIKHLTKLFPHEKISSVSKISTICAFKNNEINFFNPVSNILISNRNTKRWVAPTLRELKRRRDKLGPEKPPPRSSFLEWNYDAEIFAFGKRLGENFKSDILRRALVHKSYCFENESEDLESNEDLIEEGEAIIKQYLNEYFNPMFNEDIAKAIVEYLSSEELLAHVAKHLGLTDLVLTSEFPVEKSTLSNTFKAVIAALNQSEDTERAQKFIKDFLIVQLNGKTPFDIWEPENPVEYLNGILLKSGANEFEARLCNESASNTILANYQVGLYSDKKLLGIGWGENIEIAKNTAALDAIKKLYKLKDTVI